MMRIRVLHQSVETYAANYIQQKINSAGANRFVLGLPTGSTALAMYDRLRRLHQQNLLDFTNVVTFNMDEYVGLPPTHPQSYHYYMEHELFSAVNIQPQNAHILNGQAYDLHAECAAYEDTIQQAGGIDLFIGGVGRNGHIAFNEPGTPFDARTHVVLLAPATLQANARFFDNDISRVPTHALTVGTGTVLGARELLFMATGAVKAQAVSTLAHAPNPAEPLTALKLHPNALLLADEEAASLLPTTLPDVEITHE